MCLIASMPDARELVASTMRHLTIQGGGSGGESR